MGKFDGFLLCTDFDGTFANRQTLISDKNAEAIKYFQSEGGLFTVASGRAPGFILGYADRFKVNAPMMCMNGSFITDESGRKVLSELVLSRGVLPALDDIVSLIKFDGTINYWTTGCVRTDWNGETSLPGEYFRDIPGEIYKIVLSFDAPEKTISARDAAINKYGNNFRFERSWRTGLEILPKHGGKGAGLKKLKEILGCKVSCTIGVGDFENDISLLEAADIGYAVENAVPEVKNVADRLTVSCDENAIDAVINSLC